MGLFSMTARPATTSDPATVGGGTNIMPLDACMKAAPGMAVYQRRPLVVLEDTEQPGYGYVSPAGRYPLRYRVIATVSNHGQVTKQINAIQPRQEAPSPPTRRVVALDPERMNLELQALMSLLAELRKTATGLADQAPAGYDLESLVEAIGASEDCCGEIVMLATED